jgi:hypothetical protein
MVRTNNRVSIQTQNENAEQEARRDEAQRLLVEMREIFMSMGKILLFKY